MIRPGFTRDQPPTTGAYGYTDYAGRRIMVPDGMPLPSRQECDTLAAMLCWRCGAPSPGAYMCDGCAARDERARQDAE